MKTLYLVYAGNGTDLLLSDDEIIVNNFADTSTEYDIFERTAHAVVSALGGVVKERSLAEEHYDVIDDMFEAITPDNPSDKHIAEYIMKNSFVKEYE